MKKIVVLNYLAPILVVICSMVLVLSPLIRHYPELVTGITYDLTLTAPLLFLLLSRKSKISKLQAAPFFVIGILIATYLLPENGQQHLSLIKTYLLPPVELIVLTIVSRKIYKGIKTYSANKEHSSDFYAVSKKSCHELFGKSRSASFFASEITMMYYAFFCWKRKNPQPDEFTNYKENASMALAGALLMVACIETYAFHILLMKWSSVTAWIFTGLSIYTAFMIIGHMKALVFRPTLLSPTKLWIKNGILADIRISLNEIEKIELYSNELKSDKLKIANLGLSKESTNHNIAIHFNTPQTIEKMYGFNEECDVLLLHMDKKNMFVDCINERL